MTHEHFLDRFIHIDSGHNVYLRSRRTGLVLTQLADEKTEMKHKAPFHLMEGSGHYNGRAYMMEAHGPSLATVDLPIHLTAEMVENALRQLEPEPGTGESYEPK